MGIFLVLVLAVVLWDLLVDAFHVHLHWSDNASVCFLVLVIVILIVSVLIGLGMPTDHVAENHQLLGIKDGEKVYYMITKKDADSLNTIFVIKEDDTISEKVLDGKYVIHFDKTKPPEVVFHRAYVQNKNLRFWFFTLKGPTWYEFTVPDPSNIQQSL